MNNDKARRFEVFLSHFAEEEPVAEGLQEYLRDVFGEALKVFRASDDGSIATGEDQYPAILRALAEAPVYVVLISKYGAFRPWLNFEAGFGKARGVRLFGVLVRDTREAEVPTPLAQLELRPLARQSVVEEIVQAIAEATGRPVLSANTSGFLRRLQTCEARLPNRELSVVPFRYRTSGGESLGFELRYDGPRPIKLVKVWAEVASIFLCRNWPPMDVTGFLMWDKRQREDKSYLRCEYLANSGVPDRSQTGGAWKPLHPHQAPSPDAFHLRELRFALDSDAVAAPSDEYVYCQVETEDGASQVLNYRMSTIQERPDFRF